MEDIKVVDEQHIWFKGQQYIGLKRFLELKTNQLNEMEILQDKVLELTEKINAYEILLK